jgi:hypothetical protein
MEFSFFATLLLWLVAPVYARCLWNFQALLGPPGRAFLETASLAATVVKVPALGEQ